MLFNSNVNVLRSYVLHCLLIQVIDSIWLFFCVFPLFSDLPFILLYRINGMCQCLDLQIYIHMYLYSQTYLKCYTQREKREMNAHKYPHSKSMYINKTKGNNRTIISLFLVKKKTCKTKKKEMNTLMNEQASEKEKSHINEYAYVRIGVQATDDDDDMNSSNLKNRVRDTYMSRKTQHSFDSFILFRFLSLQFHLLHTFTRLYTHART